MSGWNYYVLSTDINLSGTEWKNPSDFNGYFIGDFPASDGAVKKESLAEIIALIQPEWDSNVWDFVNVDERGNPTHK